MTQREPTQFPSDQTGSQPKPPPPRRGRDPAASFTEMSSTVDVERLESQISRPGPAVGLCVAEHRKRHSTQPNPVNPARADSAR